MFVIRLFVCLLIVLKADGFKDIKVADGRQHLISNYVNQRFERGITRPSSRNKRQSVIRNSQPGQRPQVQGVELSPPLFIYLEDEKNLESLLTNKTLDDIIKTAERNIQSDKKNTVTNGRNPQYQQQAQQISSFMNYNTQGVYNNRNPPVAATTETVFLSYDQLSSYLPQGSTILNNYNQNDKIFIHEIDGNIKFPEDVISITKLEPLSSNPSREGDGFRYSSTQKSNNTFPSTQETKDNVYDNMNRSAKPQEIPLSIPNRPKISEKGMNKEIQPVSNASTKKNNENVPHDSVRQEDDSKSLAENQSPNYDSRTSGNDKDPIDNDRRNSNRDRMPADYDRPYDYDGRPSDYDRRPSEYERRPTYDRWNGGWNRRPNFGRGDGGWRPSYRGRGPPYRGGSPPYNRGRGPPQKDKQPPYVINLNFDSKGAYNNGTLLNNNGTLTENSNGQEQNPNIYETLKSIFNPNQGVAMGNTDEGKLHEKPTVPGLYQVTPVTPAT